MSLDSGISIFFIHSPFHELRAVENFLSKRNFQFYSESDIKQALEKIADIQPQFIFIAYDHSSPAATSLHKALNQSLMSQIVPYVNSNDPERIKRLDEAKSEHKLYPPLSGPGVQRTIQSILKQHGVTDNNNISLFQNEKPSTETIQNLKDSLINEFRSELKLQNLSEDEAYTYEVTRVSVDKAITSYGQIQKITEQNEQIQSFGSTELRLDEETKNNLIISLSSSYSEVFKDLLRTVEEPETTRTDNTISIQQSKFSYFQCFIVKSGIWCGYIVVATPVEIPAKDLEYAIDSWLKASLQKFQGIQEHDLFKISLEKSEYYQFVTGSVDFSENIRTEQSELNISFFPTRPSHLLLILNDSQEMLEVPLDVIPTDVDLPLNLYIHLPENKKYILFTSEGKPLSKLQSERLKNKGVKSLFTQLSYELALKQLKAENHIQQVLLTHKKTALDD